jgi:uncharacterized UBP type Zn finger protein
MSMSDPYQGRFSGNEAIQKLIASGRITPEQCQHLGEIRPVVPSALGCEECLESGDQWVHLRICLTCGHVGCCDNSKNKHARHHYQSSGHPLIQSFERGEEWLWCYAEQSWMRP